jgi:ABC-type multidrug transport system fused ATPase/permease subunit
MAASERLFELLDLEPDLVDAPDAAPLPPVRGEVEFDNVSFAYREGGRPVLHDLVLHAQPGDRIALVGETGGQKHDHPLAGPSTT